MFQISAGGLRERESCHIGQKERKRRRKKTEERLPEILGYNGVTDMSLCSQTAELDGLYEKSTSSLYCLISLKAETDRDR